MENYIIIAVVSVVMISIVIYLVKEKKKGRACIGCPYAKECQKSCCNNRTINQN